MPIIAMFYGVIITMIAGDREHNPPHFHAKYQDYEAEYDFDGNILAGKMHKGRHKLIAAWAEIHRDDLEADWEICRAGLSPMKIEAGRL